MAADGLPTENISGLAVDSNRQLWMATYDGISRYQGFDFRHFNRSNQPALPGNRFSRVLAAPEGGVIVQSEDGQLGLLTEGDYLPIGRAELDHAVLFDQQLWFICSDSQALWSWHPSAGSKQRVGGSVSAIAVDPFDQRLLIGTTDGRALSVAMGGQQPRALLEQDGTAILGLAGGPAGELLVVDVRRVREYKQVQGAVLTSQDLRLERQQLDPIRIAWTHRGWLLANLTSSAGSGPHLIRGTRLVRLPVPQATSASADRSPSRIEFIDGQGRRWINDGQQLFRNGELVFVSRQRIKDFIVDPFDQIWIAQPNGGLRLLAQTMIEILGDGPGELADPNISFVAEHDGRVLVGSWVELSSFDPSTGSWMRLLGQAVRDVLPEDGGLLVGTHGLCRLDTAGECVFVADFPSGSAEVLMLHRDGTGAVWAGTESGLYRRNPDRSWQPESVHPGIARAALEDDSGRLLFGTNGHGILVLQRLDEANPTVRVIGTEQGLSSEFIRTLLAVPGGGTLVGTEDAGICLLEAELDVVRCLASAEGLPHHSVHYMILDDAERVWVNSNSGVYWMGLEPLLAFMSGSTKATPDFYRLGRRHGLSSVEGNGGVYRAGARTADGRLWFPNQHGLVSIHTYNALLELDQALTTRIQAMGQGTGKKFELPRHQRHLDLELTAIALAEPQNVQFRYRFDSDPEWTEVGNRRSLNFRDLNPGRHALEVSSRYVNSPWSGAPDRLEFSVGYSMHEHPVFHALLLCTALLVLITMWLAGVRRRKRLEKEVEDRASRLSLATRQVAGLDNALRQLGVQHRAALQGVSRELKSALTAALEPLLRQRGERHNSRESERLRARTQTLSTLIEQIGSFADSGDGGAGTEGGVRGSHLSSGNSGKVGPNPSNTHVDVVRLIRMEVMLHLHDPDFSIGQLARRLGMSRSALYRQVAELGESSPAELIRDLRLEEAAKQLLESSDQVSTIAYATGFRSVSAFSRAFSKKMGVSPRLWRSRAEK